MKYLFVGGSVDGERLEVELPQPYYRKPIRSREPQIVTDPIVYQKDESGKIKTEDYRREAFMQGEKTFHVYFSETDVPEGGELRALIEGFSRYHKQS